MLDDTILLDGSQVHMSVYLVPDRIAEQVYALRVYVNAPTVIRRDVNVVVHWHGEKYPLELRAGEALFEDITLADYSLHYDNMPGGLYLTVEYRGKVKVAV